MKSNNSESKQGSRLSSLLARLKTKMAPLLDRARPLFQTAVRRVEENPHIVRSIAVLPLLITWFIGLHKEEHRSAAFRGFLLSGLFLLSSWILYWIIDLLHLYLENEFTLQWIAFTMQTILSLTYIGFSIRLVVAEYRRQEFTDHVLDRWKDRLLEMI